MHSAQHLIVFGQNRYTLFTNNDEALTKRCNVSEHMNSEKSVIHHLSEYSGTNESRIIEIQLGRAY